MIDRLPIPGLVLQSKVIAIGRNVPEAHALTAIATPARAADDLDALVGAGSVLSAAAAERAVAAGARFIVSPHTDPELIRSCTSRGVP